jgi:molybdenum cofactor cytidylyltransferase
MNFGPLPLDQALGHILGHNLADHNGNRLLRKGKPLSADDIAKLRALGMASVYVARLEPGDVGEDEAARIIGAAVMGRGLHTLGAAGGRLNVLADALGVLRIDVRRISQINSIEGITLSTVLNHAAVTRRAIAATIKVIPYALPATALGHVREICAGTAPLLLDVLQPRNAALVLSGSASARARIVRDFEAPIHSRLERLGVTLKQVEFTPLEDEAGEAALAGVLEDLRMRGDTGLIVLAGETAIMDRGDIAPRAIERAGGEVALFGAPVDPGNLLMVGYLGEIPVLGAPGCVRSTKANIVDWVLPRLLAGDRLTRSDVVGLRVGGLLEEIAERPMPRES